MFDADVVLAQARQGDFSPTWQVFRAKRTRPVLAGCSSACTAGFFMLSCALLAAVIGAFMFRMPSGHALSISDLTPAAAQSLPTIASILVATMVIAYLVGFLRAQRDSHDPDPLLVVLPIGFVEYISSRKPVMVVSFADLTGLRCRMRTTRSVCDNVPGDPASGGYTVTSTPTSTRLGLLYSNGKSIRWRPRARFGRSTVVIQSVVVAHGQYALVYGPQRHG